MICMHVPGSTAVRIRSRPCSKGRWNYEYCVWYTICRFNIENTKVHDCCLSSASLFCFNKHLINYVGYEVLASVLMKIHIFLDITPRGPLKINRRFRRTSNFRNYRNSGHYSLTCLLFKTRRFGGWTLSLLQVKPTEFCLTDRPSLSPNQTGEQEQKRATTHLIFGSLRQQSEETGDKAVKPGRLHSFISRRTSAGAQCLSPVSSAPSSNSKRLGRWLSSLMFP
jgi:hypothetical protein